MQLSRRRRDEQNGQIAAFARRDRGAAFTAVSGTASAALPRAAFAALYLSSVTPSDAKNSPARSPSPSREFNDVPS